ncbi:MAG: methyltransferase, TIGR04325 family [wastewater metagenome]|nr:methyltransferase, TIGR04325 family [Candidatus Loosdrechtia aerotolerans]
MNGQIKNIMKDFLPPVFLKAYLLNRNAKYGFFGNYTSWGEAETASIGYDSDMIVNKVKDALLKVKQGEAVYERDSVLFDNIQYSWPLLAALLWIASQNESQLNLVDFGGSLGSTYFQNRKFLMHLNELYWNIVEQEKFVECGKRYFEDKHLKFYYSIDSCFREQRPNTILFSAVIQYLEKPYDLLAEVTNKEFRYIVFDRTPFLDKGNDRITIQKVSPEIYQASYPAWFFNKENFLNSFLLKEYRLIAEFDTHEKVNIPSIFKGFIFERMG